tara:strand:+ start:2183 stop:3319 length:1137 start_codon:yes stop_codon:yes gene_type:complete
MPLTKISTDGVKDDAIDASKLPANSVGASELADNAVDTNAIANNAVTAGKLASGVQTTINNNASTKFITGSNNANELDCETNLSYNNSIVNFANSNLSIDKSSNPTITLTESTGNKATQLRQDTGGLLRTLGNYPLLLGTNQQERMRITGDGLVGIGMSSLSARFGIKGADTTNGTVELEPHANKGTSVSHIHYGATGDWYIRPASPSGYIYFDSGKTRFTNGILFGSDTAAANTLDDYEEGTYQPTPSGQTASTNVNFYSNQDTLSYQKVGNTVTVHGRVRLENNNFTGGFRITLPFTAAAGSEGNNNHQAFVATHGVDFDSSAGTGSHMALTLEIIPNDSYAYFLLVRDNAAWITADYTHIKADSYLAFQVIYKTN